MARKSKSEEIKTDFKKDIPEYSDEEIFEILKKREYYRTEAVDLAINEALKRELINSEQDLFSEEFRTETLQFGLFPNIEDDKNKQKIRKSIARGILIAGVLPTVWGFLQINEGHGVTGSLLLAGGVVWIMLAAKLIQNSNLHFVNGLFLLSVVSLAYVGSLLWLKRTFLFMDFFIVAILYSMLWYGLAFLRKLR